MSNFLTLANIETNEEGQVDYIIETQNFKLKRRLLELGFVKDAKVCVVFKSMLKEVLLVNISGYNLMVRNNIAKLIVLKS